MEHWPLPSVAASSNACKHLYCVNNIWNVGLLPANGQLFSCRDFHVFLSHHLASATLNAVVTACEHVSACFSI